MLLGYLETCYNRCMQLALPADLSSSSTLLELVSYQFPSGSSNLKPAEIDERKLHFKAQWELMLNLHVVNDAAKLIAACGGWLEKDCKSESMCFAGLLFWKSDKQADSPQRLLEAKVHIADCIAVLSREADAVVSSVTEQLHFESSDTLKPRDSVSLPVSAQLDFKYPILKTTVARQYEMMELKGVLPEDPVHLETVVEAKSHQWITASPAGHWYPMGLISQNHMPPPPPLTTREHIIEMISFRTEGMKWHIMKLFKDLGKKLWELGDCPQLGWGTDNENASWYTKHFLLIGM